MSTAIGLRFEADAWVASHARPVGAPKAVDCEDDGPVRQDESRRQDLKSRLILLVAGWVVVITPSLLKDEKVDGD